ncbi:MAG: hypothetical protein IPG55_12900 [Saprospiraceae bacterium]|nr:hypothetical protein [Candidatus Defluviibacterium haderslevense]MBK7245659.1 hypothetical protein [Candidatus Defluviibacterium haderslevense]
MNPHSKEHTLHHSFASNGLEQGNELSVMQHLLGHISLYTSETYRYFIEVNKKIQ